MLRGAAECRAVKPERTGARRRIGLCDGGRRRAALLGEADARDCRQHADASSKDRSPADPGAMRAPASTCCSRRLSESPRSPTIGKIWGVHRPGILRGARGKFLGTFFRTAVHFRPPEVFSRRFNDDAAQIDLLSRGDAQPVDHDGGRRQNPNRGESRAPLIQTSAAGKLVAKACRGIGARGREPHGNQAFNPHA